MRRNQQRAIDDIFEQMEQRFVTNSGKDLYKAIQTLTGKFKLTIDAVNNKNGVLPIEGHQIKVRWKEYCENLQKKNRPFN